MARRIAACGTDSGYFRHRRAGQRSCAPCKDAHTEAGRRRVQGLAQAPIPPEAEVYALDGGRWVQAGLIQRWKAS